MQSVKFIVITHVFILLFTFTSEKSWGFSKAEIREFQKEVSNINSGLPSMLSTEIQLTRVFLRSNSEVVYVGKALTYNKEQLDPKLIETNYKPSSVNTACTVPKIFRMIKKGMKYTYMFLDKNDKYIAEYSVTSIDCEKM